MTFLCRQLYRQWDHEGWNEFDLATLPLKDLQFLCRMMGCPWYGNKQVIIVRLLSLRIVRTELSKFADDPCRVAEGLKKSRLRWMCEQANLWKSGNKIQLAACLLSWRNRCRQAGQNFMAECIAHGKRRGRQLELSL